MTNNNEWIEEEILTIIKKLDAAKEFVKENKIRDARRETNFALSGLAVLAKTINKKADDLNK